MASLQHAAMEDETHSEVEAESARIALGFHLRVRLVHHRGVVKGGHLDTKRSASWEGDEGGKVKSRQSSLIFRASRAMTDEIADGGPKYQRTLFVAWGVTEVNKQYKKEGEKKKGEEKKVHSRQSSLNQGLRSRRMSSSCDDDIAQRP